MATASNWSSGTVPAGTVGQVMLFNGGGTSTLTFPGLTFSGSPGLGGLDVTASQTSALAITNSGAAGSVFRLRENAPVTIAAGAGAFSFGATGSATQLAISNLGDGNRFTNNSTNVATLGPQVAMVASTGSGGLAIFDGSGNWLVSGTLASTLTRGLSKQGAGTLTLSAANAYTGATRIEAGTLILSGTTRQLPIGTVLTVASGATMRITGLGGSGANNEIVGGLQGSGTVTTTNGATLVRLTIRNTSDYTFDGSFTGAGTLAYIKEGAGTQTLTGSSTNSGQWDILEGRLRIQNGAALGNTTGVTWIGSGVGSDAVLDLAGSISSAEPLNLHGRAAADAATRINNAGGTNVLTGPLTLNIGGLFYGIGSDAGSLQIQGAISRGNATGTRTLVLGGAAAGEIAGAINGSGFTLGLEKRNAGTWTISGTSSHTGPTTVLGGTFRVNGSLANTSAMTVNAGGVLGGSGSIAAALAGAGLISPGNSPGILTAPQVDPSAGTDYAFEFTGTGSPAYGSPTASINDVLRLTDLTTPFTTTFTASNAIDIYFDVAALSAGDTFRGGFYTDRSGDFLSTIDAATYSFWVLGDGSGSDRSFGGKSYYSLASFDPGLTVSRSTVAEAAAFGSGTVNGQVTQFVIVPEPGALTLLAAGMSLTVWSLWKRRRAAR